MTNEAQEVFHPPSVVVLPVVAQNPPFRLVEIKGQVAGTAHDVLDVIRLAHQAGLTPIDLDDPAQVRWVGGDKYRWVP
ncbi:hypothetical protein ACIHCQ_16930 [Streptomyces sp. NPDC052236]|uniref:hypothetical protein n=1 Tax=Streptomyces sp. NPDC052236 TaxID=3365686 RepID=UPI0037D7FD74